MRNKYFPFRRMIIVSLGIVAFSIFHISASAAPIINVGFGSFNYDYDDGVNTGKNIIVHYYRPDNFDSNSKVVFVMHGSARDAERARKQWLVYGQHHNALIVAPEFPKLTGQKSAATMAAVMFMITIITSWRSMIGPINRSKKYLMKSAPLYPQRPTDIVLPVTRPEASSQAGSAS